MPTGHLVLPCSCGPGTARTLRQLFDTRRRTAGGGHISSYGAGSVYRQSERENGCGRGGLEASVASVCTESSMLRHRVFRRGARHEGWK